jgi:3-oxoacyl-[acyl-carrier-protein] synthase III
MTISDKSVKASRCGVRIGAMGIHLPGDPIALADIDLPDQLRRHLSRTGQEFTYRTDRSSTDLGVAAARHTLDKAGIGVADIGMVISAPTLLSGYGLEIPAVAIRAELGLQNAECLNIAQGCVGALAAMRVAAQFLRCEPDRGHVLIVTACKASSLVENFTHGAFSWGDAAAAILMTAEPGTGPIVEFYAEKSAVADWGAMHIPFGDASVPSALIPKNDLRITVEFPSHESQIDYIVGEKERCGALIDALTAAAGIETSDIDAVFLPSFGRKRVPLLLEEHPMLIDRVASDFRCAHMGGVDVLYFLDSYQHASPPKPGSWSLALSPAFTAQWGGVLIRQSDGND